jgi:hypothetical protein
MIARHSTAMSGAVAKALSAHLIRTDGQEDLCFATWRPSAGRRRRTAVVVEPLLPREGERHVHGNASFEMACALRAAKFAAGRGSSAVEKGACLVSVNGR